MSDTLLRAIARDAGIQICAASTTELVERAHEIHNTTPLATAALGRTLTATAIMGSQLKVEDGSVTVQIKGNGPLGAIVCVGDSDGYVRGYLQDPAVDLPLREDGKLDLCPREKAYLQMDADSELVLKVIDEFDGVLPFNDKASPEIIKREFHMSKNAFKRAVGHLLKEGKIKITDKSIERV